jgi:hypothetical protein
MSTIGSLHEQGISLKKISIESVFHADSHGIFYFFLNNNSPP